MRIYYKPAHGHRLPKGVVWNETETETYTLWKPSALLRKRRGHFYCGVTMQILSFLTDRALANRISCFSQVPSGANTPQKISARTPIVAP
jgi:hypothetical protein